MVTEALRNPHFRLFAGAFLISFSPVFVRLVSVSPTASGFYRTGFGAVALLIFLAVSKRWRTPASVTQAALLIAALFFAADLWFWHRSVLLIGPGLSTLLANLQVFFMIAAGALLFRERPGGLQMFAALLAVVGLVLIFGRDWSRLDGDYRAGIVLGLLTALSYAGYLLSMRKARHAATDAMPVVEVTIVSIIVTFVLGAASMIEGESLQLSSVADLGWLLAYGVLAHAIGLILIASSLTAVTAAKVGIALLLQPTLTLLWDFLFFARHFTPIEIFGAVLTLTAIFLGSQRRVT